MTPNIPQDLKYTSSHEWLRLADDRAIIGLTDHAQHELTDIVFVELPARDRSLKAGEACVVVESVKTASDVYTPVSGAVVEVNQAVVDNPALINTDPYGQGWLISLRLGEPKELSALLSAEQYRALIQA